VKVCKEMVAVQRFADRPKMESCNFKQAQLEQIINRIVKILRARLRLQLL